jgi:hypothetical protein
MGPTPMPLPQHNVFLDSLPKKSTRASTDPD